MPTALGKRKLPAASPATATGKASFDDTDAIQDVFRRHFEAHFKPLHGKTAAKTNKPKAKTTINEAEASTVSADDSETGGSDWSGLSDKDDNDDSDSDSDDRRADSTTASSTSIQVIDYSGGASAADLARDLTSMTKQERRAYLSSRPLATWADNDGDNGQQKQQQRRRRAATGDEPGDGYRDAPELLANDLALQRLISESHLLSGGMAPSTSGADPASLKSARPFATGRLRQRATDLRIQAVARRGISGTSSSVGSTAVASLLASSSSSSSAATSSIFTQTSMPMSIRKGIASAAATRETKRRREARESGIVLERPALASSASALKRRRRQRPVDAPAVGRLRGSELRLRDSDVRAIEGHKSRSGPGHQHNRKKRR